MTRQIQNKLKKVAKGLSKASKTCKTGKDYTVCVKDQEEKSKT